MPTPWSKERKASTRHADLTGFGNRSVGRRMRSKLRSLTQQAGGEGRRQAPLRSRNGLQSFMQRSSAASGN